MKTVLILGAYGFIGSNILKIIDQNYHNMYQVIVFSRTSKHPKGLSFQCVTKVYTGDFNNESDLQVIFEENEIDVVIHLINSTVPSTSNNARYDIESNLIPTINLLNIMMSFQVKNIVYLSSGGSVYGSSSDRTKETDHTDPLSSYGIVKLTAEKYLQLYSRQDLLHPLILRLSNPYGPFHYSLKQGILNVALRSAIEKRPFSVWGDGTATKDYIFIDDFVKILLKLLDSNVKNEVLNIGSGISISINLLLDSIKDLHPGFMWNYIDVKVSDVHNSELDISNLLKYIGNFEFTDVTHGIRQTNDWLIKDI